MDADSARGQTRIERSKRTLRNCLYITYREEIYTNCRIQRGHALDLGPAKKKRRSPLPQEGLSAHAISLSSLATRHAKKKLTKKREDEGTFGYRGGIPRTLGPLKRKEKEKTFPSLTGRAQRTRDFLIQSGNPSRRNKKNSPKKMGG